MTTFTKEQLIKFANAILQTETAMASWDCMAGQQAKAGAAIAEIALASLEAEAVGYADPQAFYNFKSMGGKNAACTKEWMWRDFGEGLIPLFTAPPAPVVPDNMQGKAVSQNVQPVMFIDCDISPADVEKLAAAIREFNSEPGEPSQMISEPVSQPYKLPDGWVAVPVELTCEMDDAAWNAYHDTRSMSDIWAALLAAAPQQEMKS